jgi:serine/threonine protein kinase
MITFFIDWIDLPDLFRGGRYPEEEAKDVIVQILSTVAFFHLQGVVHRDLKPEVTSSLG